MAASDDGQVSVASADACETVTGISRLHGAGHSITLGR